MLLLRRYVSQAPLIEFAAIRILALKEWLIETGHLYIKNASLSIFLKINRNYREIIWTMVVVFIYHISKTRKFTGRITERPGGKFLISLDKGRYYDDKYAFNAKCVAKQIIADNFKHPDILSIKREDETFVPMLTERTHTIKRRYLEYTRKFVDRHLGYVAAMTGVDDKKWSGAYRMSFDHTNNGDIPNLDDVEKSGESSQLMCRDQETCRSIVKKGFARFKNEELSFAEGQFDLNILKWSDRLVKSGVRDTDSLRVESVANNHKLKLLFKSDKIEVSLWVKCITGEVQRPHCRFSFKYHQ